MTKRFNNAVTKLYIAFHNGTLNALDCSACAVGNICDNKRDWIKVRRDLVTDSLKFDYYKEKEALTLISKTGYSPKEIVHIEHLFMEKAMGGYRTYFIETRETQFEGLCAVIEYLAELDGIPNPFDFNKLFNEDKQVASSELAILT